MGYFELETLEHWKGRGKKTGQVQEKDLKDGRLDFLSNLFESCFVPSYSPGELEELHGGFDEEGNVKQREQISSRFTELPSRNLQRVILCEGSSPSSRQPFQ